MKLIYQSPTYELRGQALGATVELYQRFPHVEHPRDQRILQLTLPEEARERLANFIKTGEVHEH